MAALAALIPIALIIVLMIGARWGAAAAGAAGLAAALPLAIGVFGWTGPAETGLPLALIGLGAETVSGTLKILWIVFPALWLHALQGETGATAQLRAAAGGLTGDPRLTVLLVAWFFGLFAEGAAGFGTPVALAAPILVALGLEPGRAVVLALIGHAAGVSFGAVGTPAIPLIAASGLEPRALAMAIATLQGLLGWILALAVWRLAPAEGARGGTGWPLFAAAAFFVPSILIAAMLGPELPTLGGALLGAFAFVLAVRRRAASTPTAAPPPTAAPAPALLLRAALPYLLLLALILVTRLLEPLKGWLQGLELAWSLAGGAFADGLQPLYHPGTMLALGLGLGAVLRGDTPGQVAQAAHAALVRLPPVVLALLAMLGLARLMVHSGMIAALAEAAAGSIGWGWPLLAPATGVLGSFVTGSATASNILLAPFQVATAEASGLPVLPVIAAQGLGAALGNVICPHNIIAGAATVGLSGSQTGAVLARTLPLCLALTALAGLVAWLSVLAV